MAGFEPAQVPKWLELVCVYYFLNFQYLFFYIPFFDSFKAEIVKKSNGHSICVVVHQVVFGLFVTFYGRPNHPKKVVSFCVCVHVLVRLFQLIFKIIKYFWNVFFVIGLVIHAPSFKFVNILEGLTPTGITHYHIKFWL